jgi:hypothetical protein
MIAVIIITVVNKIITVIVVVKILYKSDGNNIKTQESILVLVVPSPRLYNSGMDGKKGRPLKLLLPPRD